CRTANNARAAEGIISPHLNPLPEGEAESSRSSNALGRICCRRTKIGRAWCRGKWRSRGRSEFCPARAPTSAREARAFLRRISCSRGVEDNAGAAEGVNFVRRGRRPVHARRVRSPDEYLARVGLRTMPEPPKE